MTLIRIRCADFLLQEAFFHGLQPVNLFVNTVTRSVLQKRLLRLVQPRQWIDVLLCSYEVEDTGAAQRSASSRRPADVTELSQSSECTSVTSQDITNFIHGQPNAAVEARPSYQRTVRTRRVLKVCDPSWVQ
jgi:hypothetical protein